MARKTLQKERTLDTPYGHQFLASHGTPKATDTSIRWDTPLDTKYLFSLLVTLTFRLCWFRELVDTSKR